MVKDRKTDRMIVGLLAGQCRLNKHMHTMDLTENAFLQILWRRKKLRFICCAIARAWWRTRLLVLGAENPTAHSYIKKPPSKAINLIKKAENALRRITDHHLKRSQ